MAADNSLTRLALACRKAYLKLLIVDGQLASLLTTAQPGDVRKLERVIASMEKAAGPRRGRGRPEVRSTGNCRELVRFIESIKYLARRPTMTDKEAVERHVAICFRPQSDQKGRALVALWRGRLAAARKKLRK